ncbi:phage/plasmid primase, P4 family [Sphingomonas sp. 3-13AW]|uniref:phage/plasmid primase, P4 family n=1 Tax=Sphingomonas sp. 3-13AW TaxID=3050450 RepID=UPI003BB5271B
MISTASSQLEAALHFARRGWPVFPCRRSNKTPLVARDRDADGKPINGTGGVSKATCDEAQIRAWWGKWPQAMIGVSVGVAGLIVIDFDPRVDEVHDEETGEVTTREWTLEELKAAVEEMIGEPLPVSLAVRTPSGGVHVYYRMPDGEPIGNKGSLPQHVDVRGLGGYVIVPPSHCDGDGRNAAGPYRWLRGDADAQIVTLPASLERVLRAPAAGRTVSHGPSAGPSSSAMFQPDLDASHRKYAMAALDRTAAELAATPRGGGKHGGRNKAAYAAAYNLGGFVATGVLSETLVRQVLVEVVRGFDPAAFDRHVDAIQRGIEGGKERPHDLSAVGARTARGRDSDRSADQSSIEDREAPPLSAYAEDFGGHAPAPGADAGVTGFHSGTGAETSATPGGGGRITPDRNDDLDRKCGLFAMTDLGNAERFRARHGWRFRFCNELGWFVWDGRRWELLSEEKDKVPGKVTLAVFDTVRAIGNEADAIEASGVPEDLGSDASDSEIALNRTRLNRFLRWKGSGDNAVAIYLADELRAHAKSSEGAQRIGSVANLAKAFGDVAIRADAMDVDRMAINVLNGTLRIEQRGDGFAIRLHRHRPADLISKLANVIYDPKAECPIYDRFLETVQPEVGMRRFLAQWGGLSLTGDIGEQKLVFHYGMGRNGKSTLNDLWGTIAGDYGATIAIETFLDQGRGRKGGEATPDLARLPGVRFLRTSEPEKGAKLAEALIKLVTGGEPIDARHLNKGFFTFLPSFKLSVQGNHKPKITGHDDGIWRRMLLVPWAVQIAKDQVDATLPEKLRGEASGVLNRLIAGLLDWRANGLATPEEVLSATAKYREQSDQLGRFLAECTAVEEGARSKSSVLFALYSAWVKANGAAEWQQVGFTKAMEDRGFEKKTSNGVQWLNLRMVKTVEDFTETSASGGDPGPDYDDYPPI